MSEKYTDILLIEDNEIDAWLLEATLAESSLKAHIHSVDEGQEALNFLLKLGIHKDAPTPDIIFLDLHMPIMDGWEFLNTIRGQEAFKNIPVVILTTSTRERDIEKSEQYNILAYLDKPVLAEQVIEIIHTLSKRVIVS